MKTLLNTFPLCRVHPSVHRHCRQ